MRRIPLWLTLMPLLVGGVAWRVAWTGWRDQFRADLMQVLRPGGALTFGGFPYRLAAWAEPAGARLDTPELTGSAEAGKAQFNQQPWARALTVVTATDVRLAFDLTGITGLRGALAAPRAQASVRLDGSGLKRLSMVLENPAMTFGVVPRPVTARRFEVHLLVTPVRNGREVSQAQLALSGEGVRLGQGDPLSAEVTAYAAGAAPLRSVAAWAAGGGSIRVERIVLADATGEVLRMTADAEPTGPRLMTRGTLTTVCPFTVRAAFAGQAPPPERRARLPVTLAYVGLAAGGLALQEPPGGLQPLPTRDQLPPCPAIVR